MDTKGEQPFCMVVFNEEIFKCFTLRQGCDNSNLLVFNIDYKDSGFYFRWNVFRGFQPI